MSISNYCNNNMIRDRVYRAWNGAIKSAILSIRCQKDKLPTYTVYTIQCTCNKRGKKKQTFCG